MSLSAEALLMLAIFGLYLYDASLLLHCNEAVFSPRGKRDWNVRFGSPHMGTSTKELFVPNLLLFHRPTFKLSWSFESTTRPVAEDLRPVSFAPLAPVLWALAAGLFLLLPLGFFTRLGDRALLSALIIVFGSIFFALAWAWSNRAALDLTPRRFFALAFESIVCPPFALNLVRHLSLPMVIREDAVAAARRVQSRESWRLSRSAFLARLDAEIELEKPASERHAALMARRDGLLEERDR